MLEMLWNACQRNTHYRVALKSQIKKFIYFITKSNSMQNQRKHKVARFEETGNTPEYFVVET